MKKLNYIFACLALAISAQVMAGSAPDIKEGVVLGENISFGKDVEVKKFATIGDDVTIGDKTKIGEYASIGNGVTIGKDVEIKKNAVVGDNVSVGDKSRLGESVSIGAGVVIGKDTEIKKNAIIGENVVIGDKVKIDDGAIIEAGAVLANGAKVKKGETVTAAGVVVKGQGKKAKRDQRRKGKRAGRGYNDRADPQDPTAALAALERHSEALLTDDNVVGTGVSWKQDGTPVIKVFTKKKTKKAKGKKDAATAIPDSLDGIEVVTAEVGAFFALNLSCEQRPNGEGCLGQDAATAQNGTGQTEAVSPADWHVRPVPIGVSIGNATDSAGTLGCRVSSGCHNYALSAGHVIAEPGTPILQPSAIDGGLNPDDEIASMFASVPIVLGTSADVQNRVDAALYEIEGDQVGTATRENGYGEPRVETIEPSLDLNVMKYGRSSSLTTGFVDTIAATVIISYANGDARFVDQIIVRSDTRDVDFSLPGDSGALVVAAEAEDDRKPVGLLFASGRGYTVANPINEVLTALGADIDGEF